MFPLYHHLEKRLFSPHDYPPPCSPHPQIVLLAIMLICKINHFMQICREYSACDEAVDICHLEGSKGRRRKIPGKKYTFRLRFKFCIQVSFRLG